MQRVNGGAGAALVMASAQQKRAASVWRPKSWEERAEKQSAYLSPSSARKSARLFPAVFTQKGKWLRDRFFGTEAVKSVHGIERPRVRRFTLAGGCGPV